MPSLHFFNAAIVGGPILLICIGRATALHALPGTEAGESAQLNCFSGSACTGCVWQFVPTLLLFLLDFFPTWDFLACFFLFPSRLLPFETVLICLAVPRAIGLGSMASNLASRIKSKLSLHRRNSTSGGASASSSNSRLTATEEDGGVDARSSRSSGSHSRRRYSQPLQTTSIQTAAMQAKSQPQAHSQAQKKAQPRLTKPRPKSNIEIYSKDTSSSAITTTIPPAQDTQDTAPDIDALKRPRPKSTPGLTSPAGAAPTAANSAGSCARSCASGGDGAEEGDESTKGPAEVAASPGGYLSDASVSGLPGLSAASKSAPQLPAPHPDTTTEATGPAVENTAPSPPLPSPESDILHHQRLQLQHRLKRLAQDPHPSSPLAHDLPSPSNLDLASASSSALPALQSIYEHTTLHPAPKLRSVQQDPEEHWDPRADLSHRQHTNVDSHPHAPLLSPSSPSTSTRDRHYQSPPANTAPATLRPSAAPRRRSGSGSSTASPSSAVHHSAASTPPSAAGPAPRRTSTARTAHFSLDPAPEYAAPSLPNMSGARKIWVRRPGASPTLVTIGEDDLVDDVRDIILRKYANSLGKTFDAPDLHIRIHPRDQKDRLLQPDEHMCRTLDNFYPDGQTVDDAIVIDIPRRTPKASPQHFAQAHQPHSHQHPHPQQIPHTAAAIYYTEDGRPLESGEGYFPPVGALPSPHMQLAMPPGDRHASQTHSIAVLGTGHLPTIPSPGSLRPGSHGARRPRLGRTNTSSSAMNSRDGHGMQHRPRIAHSRTHSSSSDPAGMPPGTVPLPTSSMPKSPGHDHIHPAHVGTPPARMVEPRSTSARPKRRQKNASDLANNGGIMASVPPISVLIVEDNPINLKLLEAFMKRLKVRWQTATNGRDAVKKWRSGGFHLVLMDIQLPVMNGLEATREIRRLERVNSIGVFSSVPSTPQEELVMELQDKDRLDNLQLFKGPVIIVALTASSLQSDRHEALAAGCNDFLTKVCRLHVHYSSESANESARQLCLAGTQSHGMGLHAGPNRL